MEVSILEGCIACNVCESICPEVFTVKEISIVDSAKVPGNEQLCLEAANACPVDVIAIKNH